MGRLLCACVLLASIGLAAQRAVVRPGVDPTTFPYWHVKGTGWGTPAADDVRVFFLDRSGYLIALDRKNGEARWRQPTHARSGDPTGWQIRIADDKVISGDSSLRAFDRQSGTPRWSFAPMDDGSAGSYLGSIVNGVAYLGSPAGRIYAVDTESGRERWRAAVSAAAQTLVLEPVADEDIVAAVFRLSTMPQTGGVIALDARTGVERWRTMFPRPPNGALGSNGAGNPVLTTDVVLAAAGYGEIFAFDRRTGAVQWSLPKVQGLPSDYFVSTDYDFRVLALGGTRLIAGSLTGAVTAYDVEAHHELWRNTGQRLASVGFGIAVDGNTAYVPYLGGRLVAIDLETGAERWQAAPAGGGFSFPPLIAGSRLFVANTASGFYALRW